MSNVIPEYVPDAAEEAPVAPPESEKKRKAKVGPVSKAPVIELEDADDAPYHHRAAARVLRKRHAERSLDKEQHRVYIAPSLLTYEFNGETRKFDPLVSTLKGGRRGSICGGIVITDDQALVDRLDHYAIHYSGDVQRVQ